MISARPARCASLDAGIDPGGTVACVIAIELADRSGESGAATSEGRLDQYVDSSIGV